MRSETAPTQSDPTVLSQGLHVVTSLPRTGIDDSDSAPSANQDSIGLPSPDPSSPGLRTPMVSCLLDVHRG